MDLQVVSPAAWRAVLDELRVKEKAATRARDALAAERRRLPIVGIEKKYLLEGPGGSASLLDLIQGGLQLIVYHFKFGPGVEGWPAAGCVGCSMFTDNLGHLDHLYARNTSFALVSRAPLANIEPYKKRMGWTMPWVSSGGSDFNADFGATVDGHETFGLSVFLRDGDTIYRSYFTAGRGVETLGPVWTLLDLTPLGRQEAWEDSPAGWPQTAPEWRRRDEYENGIVRTPE
jgi:predicted dithiol-disulfide oxidoreductase (DUF899 family)